MKNICKNCKYYEFIDKNKEVDIYKHYCYYESISSITGQRDNTKLVYCIDARKQSGHCGIEGRHFLDKNQLLME